MGSILTYKPKPPALQQPTDMPKASAIPTPFQGSYSNDDRTALSATAEHSQHCKPKQNLEDQLPALSTLTSQGSKTDFRLYLSTYRQTVRSFLETQTKTTKYRPYIHNNEYRRSFSSSMMPESEAIHS